MKLLIPVRFKAFYPYFAKASPAILDIGCGNHSPSVAKRYFPTCEYHGVDKIKYNLDERDEANMHRFYSVDLDRGSMQEVPDRYFDMVLLSHVLEHLQDPGRVVQEAARKLKPGGHIYIEFPSLKSLGLPSRKGTLQFCDDSTHIHLPNPYEIANLLLKERVRILSAKVRRDIPRLLAGPFFWLYNGVQQLFGRPLRSKGLWDLYGFAYYLHGIKQP